MAKEISKQYAKAAFEEGKLFPNGFAVSGTLEKALKKIFGDGIETSIQDNVFQFHPVFQPSQVNKTLLTPTTGLIGSVSKIQRRVRNGASKKEKTKVINGIRFKSQILPGILPGRLVEIESKYENGDYVIQECGYAGGTRSNTCEIECEAVEFRGQ